MSKSRRTRMKVNKEQLDKVQVKLTIEVDDDFFAEHLDKAIIEQKKKITIPGFRKGKAPRALIEQHYGKEYFYYDAAESCVYPAYLEVLGENEDIKAIGQPKFDVVQLESEKPFIFSAIVDTKQTIALPDYKGISIEKIDVEVTDEEIENELKRIQENTALFEVKTGEDASVENGDVVILDFEGKKDDVPFEGGTAKDYELTIGSNSFIPGFEDAMVGMALGEEKDIPLTFPEQYHAADLAGKDVVFTVKVNEIKGKQVQDINDEFAKDVSEFETLDDLKADIRKNLTEQKEQQAENQYKQAASNIVTEGSDVVAPESMVEHEAENYLNEFAYNLRSQGLELEQFIQLTGGNMDDMKKDFQTRAEGSVKQQLVLEAIAEAEGITVSDEEIDEEYEKLAQHYKMEKDQLKQIFMIQGQAEALRRNIEMEKTVDFILKEANIG